MSEATSRRSRLLTCTALVLMGGTVAAGTLAINVWRYGTYRTAWPLDLAYFNHQLWNLSSGMQPITLQPGNYYASDGPEPWRMAHLKLFSFVFWPIHAAFPGVETLLILQALFCGSGVWPMYSIAARRSGHDGWGLASAAFYATSPCIWLLGPLDFRYLTVGLPLALMAYDGIERRSRRRYLTAAILAMMARQVFAVALALLAVVHFAVGVIGGIVPRDRARVRFSSRLRWLAGPVLVSVAWFWLDQGFLWWQHGPEAVRKYWTGMQDPAAVTSRLKDPVTFVLESQQGNLLRYGPGMVAGVAAAPEMAVAALALTQPPLRMGQWALDPAQHLSRYATLAVVALLAGGAVSFGRLGRWSHRWGADGQVARYARLSPKAVAGVMLVLSAVSGGRLIHNTLTLPQVFSAEELAVIEQTLAEIRPEDCVMASHHPIHAAYSVLAPLSSRTSIFDYNQLPRRRTASGALRRMRLTEALSEVEWCIVCRPTVADRSDEVRHALAQSRQFELRAAVERVEVYQRRRER